MLTKVITVSLFTVMHKTRDGRVINKTRKENDFWKNRKEFGEGKQALVSRYERGQSVLTNYMLKKFGW